MAFGTPLTRWVYDHSPAAFRNYMASVYSRGRTRAKFGLRWLEHLADLERTQWYSNVELRALQDEKVRRVLWHASRYVPFYRAKLAAVEDSSPRCYTRAHLECLPRIEKSTVQAKLQDFRSSLYLDAKDVDVVQTSGTTGKALAIYVDKAYFKLEKAFLWLQRGWVGVQLGDASAQFTGQPVVPVRQTRPPFWIYDAVENRTIFSLQHMSWSNMRSYANELVRLNPKQLVGYPTAIYLMALYLRENGITSIRPKGIFTASETLLPHQRTVIEGTFDCRVLDLYGACEYAGMVLQCEQGNYHVQEEYGVLEIIAPDGTQTKPGEIGEIVSSGLNNLAMPFIRYRTGDTAVPKVGACPCKRGGALVDRITGRIEDVVVTPDGRLLSRLDFVFKEMPEVREAQIIQEARDLIRLRIVPTGALSASDRNRVLANLRDRAGDKMRFHIEIVDHIPRLPNGKYRYVVSRIPLGWGGAEQTGKVVRVEADEDRTL